MGENRAVYITRVVWRFLSSTVMPCNGPISRCLLLLPLLLLLPTLLMLSPPAAPPLTTLPVAVPCGKMALLPLFKRRTTVWCGELQNVNKICFSLCLNGMDYGLFFLFAVLSSMRPNFDIIRSRMRTVLIDSLRAIPGGISGFRSAH